MINKEKYIDLLVQLLAIPALSKQEKTRVDFLENWLINEGLSVRRIKNNLVISGDNNIGGKEILLNSHIDTVPAGNGWNSDPFLPERDHKRITALGSNDAGASVVAMLAAFLMNADKNRLVMVISAEEEISGKNGMVKVLPVLSGIKFGIVGEPTRMQPAIAERGLMVIDAVAEGANGHAARNEGINAIYNALDDIMKIRQFRFPEKSEWLDEPALNVTIINAGKNHNVVPAKCEFVIDVRSNDRYSNTRILDILENACASTINPRSTRLKSSYLDHRHPVYSVFEKYRLKPFGSQTLSDMALMSFPAVKIGPGDSSRSHSPNEFILINELFDAIEKYNNIINEIYSVPL
ncbi:MAG: M20/M25/M40 family metallo-hydrolase [Bacteroidales bacterium]|nr:M20/M25/M40 family metallo-hydrolase [Bacteroidales bacterium]